MSTPLAVLVSKTDDKQQPMTSSRQLLTRLASLALVVFCLAGTARAEELVVGLEDIDFYPYGKPGKDEVYVGYLRSLLDAFAADRGHVLEYAVTPIKRLYLGFSKGEVDFFVPDNPAWSQEYKGGAEIYYSAPVAIALDGFAVLPGREEETIGVNLVHIGVFLGVTVEPLFDESQKKTIVFDRTSRFESLFRTLFLGRVDAVYCNQAAAHHVVEGLGKKADSIAWNVHLPRFRSEFHVSSTRPELIEELDAWLHEHADRVKALKEEYGILEGESVAWGD